MSFIQENQTCTFGSVKIFGLARLLTKKGRDDKMKREKEREEAIEMRGEEQVLPTVTRTGLE